MDKRSESRALVDPENKYGLTDEQKEFVLMYLNYRDIPFVANLMGIDKNKAKSYFADYGVQQEYARLNHALILSQFKAKMLSLSELGGWLSTLITEEGLPEADKVNMKTKMEAAKILIELNDKMNVAIDDPIAILNTDIETEADQLTVAELHEIIKKKRGKNDAAEEKEALIMSLPGYGEMTPDDIAFLRTLSIDELMEFKKEMEESRNGKPEQAA